MSLTTEQVRAKLLDYSLGLLPSAEEAQVERAMLENGALAEEAQRLRDLLQTARRSDALEWTETRSAANFAAIAAALGSVPDVRAERALASAVELDAAASTAPTTEPMKRRRFAGWLVAAAAVLIGLSAGFAALDSEDSSVASPTAAGRAPVATPAATAAVPPAQTTAVPVADVWASLPRTGSRPGGFPGSVFASSGADWRAQSEHDWTVYLADGALLIEWMPQGAERLVVRTPSETVEVTGTVFAIEVTREATEVSVVEGSVEISRTDDGGSKQRAEISRGERWRSDEAAAPISGAVSTAAGLRIDLSAHRAWMAARRSKQAAVPAKQAAKAAVKPTGTTEGSAEARLSTLADEASARGEHTLAAALLEQWVERAPAASTRRAAKLDLARIYLYELHQPERGAAHLRELLDGAPSDRLAVTLRSELCSLRLAKDAPRCGAE